MKYHAFRQRIKSLPLFSTSQLGAITDRPMTLKVQIAQWKKKGLVSALRRGLYTLGPEERHEEPDPYYLGNQIFIPSYISLESALCHHDLIPEHVPAITSVTTRKTCHFKNEFGRFYYRHIQPEAFDGFKSISVSKKYSALMATPEKAVVDFIYLNLEKFGRTDRAIFKESYRFQSCEDLNHKEIMRFAKLFNNKKLLLICRLFIQEMCP